MKILLLLLFVVGATQSVLSESTVTEEYFSYPSILYTSQNDIVKLIVPIVQPEDKFSEESSQDESIENEASEENNNEPLMFFVEGKVKDGKIVETNGLYSLKNRVATKLLDNGVDITSSPEGLNKVYFAATDGVYVYNPIKNRADKYGSVTDSIISIANENYNDTVYALTASKQLLKITENGEKVANITDVRNAEQIMMDGSNNLFYYADDKVPYVVTANGVKKIEGLPENPSRVLLIRPPSQFKDQVYFLSDKRIYAIYDNGSSKNFNLKYNAMPTAFALEYSKLIYYGYNKKIYYK